MPGSAPTISDRVRATIARFELLAPSDRVLVALSGGPDSVCLLYVLRDLGYALEVAHFNHQTRGAASDLDAAFAKNLAALLDAPYAHGSADVPAEAQRTGESFEACARRLRYAFLVKTARARGCGVIATGHTASDQAETVLMRVVRGASPEGVAGIPARGVREGIPLARPLIEVYRDDVEAYLRAHDFPCRRDASNDDPVHLRNRVRGELMPFLETSFNTNVRDALVRLAAIQSLENDFFDTHVEALTRQALGDDAIDRAAFREAHSAVQRRALARWAYGRGARPGFPLLDAAATFIAGGPTGQRFDLGDGILLCNGVAITVVERAAEYAEAVSLTIPGVATLLGQRIAAARRARQPRELPAQTCTGQRQVFDGGVVTSPLVVRPWRPGDRFTPFGMTGTKKVADYLAERHVPAPLRRNVLLLLDKDAIIWVVGHGRSSHGPVTPDTEEIVEVQVTHETE